MATCKECGEECLYYQGDDGIGSYEFWGAKGFDSQPVVLSKCCDAEVEGDVEFEEEYDPRWDDKDEDF